MPTTKRTIKLRQANTLGQEFIRVENKKGVQWASCNKSTSTPALTSSSQISSKDPFNSFTFGFVTGPLFMFTTFAYGVVQIASIPIRLSQTLLSSLPFPNGTATPEFTKFTKPCDPHQGLY